MDYASAERIWRTARNPKRGKPLANNTYLRRREDGAFEVWLHDTAVVTIHADGTWTLDSGDWRTVTTRERIESYSPARIEGTMESGWTGKRPKKERPWQLWNFAERSGDWSARGFADYFDGVRIGANGMPV